MRKVLFASNESSQIRFWRAERIALKELFGWLMLANESEQRIWLRCWFNQLDSLITSESWAKVSQDVRRRWSLAITTWWDGIDAEIESLWWNSKQMRKSSWKSFDFEQNNKAWLSWTPTKAPLRWGKPSKTLLSQIPDEITSRPIELTAPESH
jgi:hypothetical protein